MPSKKETGFRFRKAVQDGLKAMVDGPPPDPVHR
jgi:hypothetical protein